MAESGLVIDPRQFTPQHPADRIPAGVSVIVSAKTAIKTGMLLE